MNLSDDERARARVEIGLFMLKNRLYQSAWLLQIAAFVAIVVWFPRGPMFTPVIFAYIAATFLALMALKRRLVQQFVSKRYGTGAVGPAP